MKGRKVCIIIPSRWNSSRFVGKPMADIGGKTMIQRVYER
jgi:3-deoxy-manno-octulosonate cytidylyltransferase (CMP-KDO synthetase)